jgi:Predicted pPIWI-associating nuclease
MNKETHMPGATLDEQLAALKPKAIDDFSRSCLEGARRALGDRQNPLRINLFSAAMRILFEHMMDTMAPIDEVLRSPWFKPEKDDGKPTRGQRIVYAIQGGPSEDFVRDNLKVDAAPLRKRLLAAVDECSKQVHAREYTVIADPDQQDAMAAATIAAVGDLLDAVHFCRRAILEPIVETLDDAAVEALMSETILEVDELATHHYIQEIYVADTTAHAIGPETITYRSTGSIDVILQFGSNSDVARGDGAELEQSFPFSCDIEIPLLDPWDLGLAETRYGVDVSSWRDAMKPDEVDLTPEDGEDY